MDARQKLRRMVAEAREDTMGPSNRSGTALIEPEALKPVPGSRLASKKSATKGMPPKVEAGQVRGLIEQALVKGMDIEMVYKTRTGQSLPCKVQPQRLAFKADDPVLVGLDREENERRTFMLDRIERLELIEAAQ